MLQIDYVHRFWCIRKFHFEVDIAVRYPGAGVAGASVDTYDAVRTALDQSQMPGYQSLQYRANTTMLIAIN